MNNIKINIFNSNIDAEIAEHLKNYLCNLPNTVISILSDIPAGKDIENWISNSIIQSDIIVILLSSDCLNKEYPKLKKIFELHNLKKTIIPIEIRKCLLELSDFNDCKVLKLKDYDSKDDCFYDISKQIYEKKKIIIPKASAGNGFSNLIFLDDCYPYGIVDFEVQGDSMKPKFENGEIITTQSILVDRFVENEVNPKIGLCYVFEVEEIGCVLKKLEHWSDEKIVLKSLNHDYSDIMIDNKVKIKNIRIVKNTKHVDY